MYGGLGDRHSFGLHDTSHYLAAGSRLELAIRLDVTDFTWLWFETTTAHKLLMRWGVSREITGFGFDGQPALWRPQVKVICDGTWPFLFRFSPYLSVLAHTQNAGD